MIDEKALADVIAAELDTAEMVLTDPLTLRRLKAERIARAVLQALRPGSTGEAEGWVLVPRTALQPIADIADQYEGMLVEEDVPILAAGQARLRLKHVRTIRAMLAAAGGRGE